jgi:two-component system, NtrC family, sensor kinase
MMETAPPPRRILVVDDDVELLGLLAELIVSEGQVADTAASGRAALEKIATGEYDLILCDIRMPELDGLEVYEELERRWPHLLNRFVFIAADAEAQRERLQGFLDRTGVPIIAKPISRHSITRAILGKEY